ncbi:general amidase [Fusarium beomiforme]|uniref:General amidase n=1 Tax=Fusarium beomiforme TaxID=44412 RepID=A0A9P5DRM3_9HYPO|nr:general amidase [Fusarium beomiforme]
MAPSSIDPEPLPWQSTVQRKKQQQNDILSKALSDLESYPKLQDVDIDKLADATNTVNLISKGQLTCKTIVQALIQSLTEVAFNDALQQAEELDAYMIENKKPIGPLHGVVITLKDQFNVKGYDSTLGYVGRSFDPAQDDAVLVKMLKSLGAIVLAKSNLPQSIMWCETENPLWGLTTNPMNKDYTPGGSTGGEAVLLATGASMLGWGTDIGGSIRIPSHMMGIYGLKPSGVPVSTEGQEHVPSSIGPMARDLSMIKSAMYNLIESKPWEHDARCAPLPWRGHLYEEMHSRPLTIGVLMDDGVVRPHPPITRTLRDAVEALKLEGHEIVEWNTELHEECIRTMDLFYAADGGEDIRQDISKAGEPFIPHVKRLVNRGKAISVYEYWKLNKKKWDLQQGYLEKWNSIQSATGRKADILLMPVMPHTAVRHGGCGWVGYTKVWNVLDYTAMVIPGGTTKSEDADVPFSYPARGPEDEWNQELWNKDKEEMASMNLPIGLQVVGRKLEEEKVLGAAEVIDRVVKKALQPRYSQPLA